MSAPIALQLYSIREDLAKGFKEGIEKIAGMGYVGVETAGFPGTTPQEAAKLFRDLNLKVCSAHTGLPVGDAKAEILDTMGILGATRIISGKGPNDFASLDLIKKTCDLFNEASVTAKENGMTFGIHNHWWEFQKVEGRLVYQVMLEHLEPEIFFEIDTYWVQTGGCDPAAVVSELGLRAPYLHIKDGPCEQGQPMVAVGDGKVDFPKVIEAGKPTTEWLVVELDACATDMMEAVDKSIQYLVDNGLGRGSR